MRTHEHINKLLNSESLSFLSPFKSIYTVSVARPIYVSIIFLIVISIFSY